MTVDVLVPYFEDTAGRRELWEFNRGLWARGLEGVRVYVGDDPWMERTGGKGQGGRGFNRGRARNRAAGQGEGEWLLAYDSDAVPPEEAVLEEAVRRAAAGGVGWAPLFAGCVVATPAGTRAYMRGELGDGDWTVGEGGSAYRFLPFAIGPTVVRRDVFGSVGGYDERFVGWGVEDLALRAVLKALRGEPWGHPHAQCLSLTLDPEDADGKAREGAANSELYKREYAGLDRGRALDLIWRIRDSGCE